MVKAGKRTTEIVDQVTSFQALAGIPRLKGIYEKPRNWKSEVFWFHGPTGTGKTRCVYGIEGLDNVYTPLYSHSKLEWFENYDADEVVLIDDFRPNMCSFDMFLRLLDRYPMLVNIKGSSRQFLARKIYITSPLAPLKCCEAWTDEDPAQLLRRIDLTVDFTPDKDEVTVTDDHCILLGTRYDYV